MTAANINFNMFENLDKLVGGGKLELFLSPAIISSLKIAA